MVIHRSIVAKYEKRYLNLGQLSHAIVTIVGLKRKKKVDKISADGQKTIIFRRLSP